MDIGAELLKLIRERFGQKTETATLFVALAAFWVGCIAIILGALYTAWPVVLRMSALAIEGGLDKKKIASWAVFWLIFACVCWPAIWLIERRFVLPRREKILKEWREKMAEIKAANTDLDRNVHSAKEIVAQAKEDYLELHDMQDTIRRLVTGVVEYADEHGIKTDEALVHRLLQDIAKRKQQ